MLQLVTARKLLEMALGAFGSTTEEGQAALTALKALAKVATGDTSQGLQASEAQALTQAAGGQMTGPQPQMLGQMGSRQSAVGMMPTPGMMG